MVARIIHATADVSFAETCVIGAEAVSRLEAALAAGAPVVVDANMVAAGITRYPTACLLDEVPTAPDGSTRSAEAIAVAARRWPAGAVFVIGNAPTALFELLRLHDAGNGRPGRRRGPARRFRRRRRSEGRPRRSWPGAPEHHQPGRAGRQPGRRRRRQRRAAPAAFRLAGLSAMLCG